MDLAVNLHVPVNQFLDPCNPARLNHPASLDQPVYAAGGAGGAAAGAAASVHGGNNVAAAIVLMACE